MSLNLDCTRSIACTDRRLFFHFHRASPFTHTTWGGSGLGLWIARSESRFFSLTFFLFFTFSLRVDLCELQAGRIEVASTVGEGSIFRCFITARSVDRGLKQDDSRAIPVIEGITAPNASRGEVPRVFLSKPEEDSAPLSGVKVLCCEYVLSRLSRSFLDFLRIFSTLLNLLAITEIIT